MTARSAKQLFDSTLWPGLCLLLTLGIFWSDILTLTGFDHDNLYLVIIACGAFTMRPGQLVFLTGAAILCAFAGLYLSPPAATPGIALVNRGITVAGLCLLCGLGIVFRHRLEISRKGEQALVQSQSIIDQQRELLEIATTMSRMGGWSITVPEGRISWSDYVCALHGMPPGYVPTLDEALQAYSPLWQAQVGQLVDACLAEGAPFEQDAELIAIDGSSSWVRISGQAVRNEAGSIIRLQGYMQNITAERESQMLLVQLRHRFHQLANAVPQIIWTAEPDGALDYVNKAFSDYCGVTANTRLLGSGWQSLIHDDDISRFNAVWPQMLASAEYHTLQFRIRRSDGEFRRHVVQAHPVKDDNGQLIKWCGSAVDVHENWILAESQTRILESITDAFIAIDSNWCFTYVNREAEQLLQRTREELIGNNVWEQFPDAGNFEEHYLRAVATQTTVSFQEYYSGIGKWFDVRAFPADDGLIVYFRDVTAAHHQAEEMRQVRERFEILARATTDAIWDWDLLTDTLWWNDSMFSLFGYSTDEMTAATASWSRRLHPDDRDAVMASVEKALAGTTSDWQCEYRFCRKDGSIAHVLDRGCIIRNMDGKPVRMIGGMVDVTENHLLQERLGQAQRLEAVGQLTGGVAHDFNNLLTVIIGNAELLTEQLTDNKTLFSLVDLINQAAGRASKLTRHLLAFARRQPLEPEITDIGKLIDGMATLLRSTLRENYQIVLHHADDIWPVLVDGAQLENAMLNLCLNARDAMAEGGRLSVETSNVELDQQYAARHNDMPPGHYVMIVVSDTGAGMSPETLRHAFEPFFTTKSAGKGTGLGLSMVYGFIKQSRGYIYIYSEAGHGTTVRMYLPRSDTPVSQAAIPEAVPRHRGSETVLVVEDDALVSVYARQLLLDMGYRVLSAANGPDALDILQRTTGIDLLFTDIVMPGGMNGRELADAAQALRPDLKVLFTSGYTENAIMQDGHVDAGVHLLSKPYQRKDLVSKLRKVMGEP